MERSLIFQFSRVPPSIDSMSHMPCQFTRGHSLVVSTGQLDPMRSIELPVSNAPRHMPAGSEPNPTKAPAFSTTHSHGVGPSRVVYFNLPRLLSVRFVRIPLTSVRVGLAPSIRIESIRPAFQSDAGQGKWEHCGPTEHGSF